MSVPEAKALSPAPLRISTLSEGSLPAPAQISAQQAPPGVIIGAWRAVLPFVIAFLAMDLDRLGRPDLACEARLKLVEYQTEAKDHRKAFDGLAVTVRKFPEEGRYVPKMVTRMQDVAKDVKGGDALMAKFWLEILPRVPARRGDTVSEDCVKRHEQGLAYLKDVNKPKDAAVVEQSLARVKSGKAP